MKKGIRPREALEKFDTDSWEHRASRWGRDDSRKYRNANVRIKNQTPINDDEVITDGFGNITAMPLLVGKPCFGIPTAFLKYGGTQMVYVHRDKSLQPSSCMKCLNRASCERVAKERIENTPELMDAIQDWQDKGGRSGLKRPTKYPKCKVAFEKVTRIVKFTPFRSSNDKAVRDFYEEQKRQFLEKDKLRKRKEREKKIKAGQLDDQTIQWLERERKHRLFRLEAACRDEKLPPKLRHLDHQGVKNTADVWLEKNILELEKGRSSASAIATRLIANGRSNGLSHNSLRARVSTDLARIKFLEKHKAAAASESVFPVFNAKRELAAFIKRELE